MLRLTFWNGEAAHHFDPLEIGAFGFVVDSKGCRSWISALASDVSRFSFVDHDGNSIPIDVGFTEFDDIRAIVIYPDGSLWDGSLGVNSRAVSGFFWGGSLLRSLSEVEFNRAFHKKDWRDVPTTLVIRGDELKGGCSRIEHQCGKQCEIKILRA